ncbi:MAG: hypothetical protein WCK58_17855, partial [Chloroflexota bacterium]
MTGPAGEPAPGGPLRDLLFADLPPARARDVFARGGEATRYIVELAAAAEGRDQPAALRAIAGAPPADRETRLH